MIKGGKDNRNVSNGEDRDQRYSIDLMQLQTQMYMMQMLPGRTKKLLSQNLTGRMKASFTLLLLMQIKHKTIQQI